MLTIEAHHLVIERFCAKAIILSSQGVASKKQQGKNPSTTSLTKEFSNTTVSSISKGFVSLIFVLGFIVFQLSGDVESNPSPIYAIEKVYCDLFIKVAQDLELLQVYNVLAIGSLHYASLK